MTLRSCPHEPEIRQLLDCGHWPQACTPELRSHVENCRACSDLVLVTQAFRSARVTSAQAANLPSPGVIWWRAQLRRRNAAVERMNKPILGAQIFAFSITLVIAVVFAISQAKQSMHWLSWLASLVQSPVFDWKILWPFTSGWFKPDATLLYLVPGLAMLVLLGGVVVYFASEKQ
jgi:hypothetical protein